MSSSTSSPAPRSSAPDLAAGVAMPRQDGVVVGAPQHLQGGHAHEQQAPGREDARQLGDGGAVVGHPAVVQHVEGGHEVERGGAERQREHAGPGGQHAAAPAEAERVLREVDSHRAAAAAEMREVVAGAAARVEDAPSGLAGRQVLVEQGGADGAHARVPPLPLLRLVHPRVLFDSSLGPLHHRAGRASREDDAVDERRPSRRNREHDGIQPAPEAGAGQPDGVRLGVARPGVRRARERRSRPW